MNNDDGREFRDTAGDGALNATGAGDAPGETRGAPAGDIHGDDMEVIGDATGETRGEEDSIEREDTTTLTRQFLTTRVSDGGTMSI